jgi:hypothetical protein
MLKYLTRYTHRVALSNNRLSDYDGQHVNLSYKDYADGCRRKELRLSASDLIRRFCLHIVPKGFVRVRHYGLLTNRDHGKRLGRCRALLRAAAPAPTVLEAPATGASQVPSASAAPLSAFGAVPLPASWPVLLPLPCAVAALKPSSSAAAVVAPAPLPALPTPCPTCGSVQRELIWLGERPHGRHWREVEPWNSS